MTDLTDEQYQIMTEGVVEFNDTLLTQSINLSGQAFNNALRLGCGLLIVPLIILLAITFATRGVDFSAIFVYSFAALMLSAGFAILVANRAKHLVVQDKYEQDVGPDIAHFLADHGFRRAQFDHVADAVLPADAPLRKYLVRPASEPRTEPEPDQET
ncbi:MAG TPA: hypothetical protein VMN57_15235 [Anaerolineales bacterium]|nr:hypothetical protein [Anaerolineales bacterium]